MTGTIQHIVWARGSGIATVTLLDDDGNITRAHADAGALFRSLRDSGASIGSRISYEVTDYGTMESFQVEN